MIRDEKSLREEATAIARGLASGNVLLLDGVRRMASLRFQIKGCERDEDFLVFAVIDSETDHIPETSARGLCTPSWLEACDAELRDIGVFYERQIQDACNKLIARFSAET
ncbi:MAG: hypothetical protein CFE46_09605 [Burkholderiales bacterium PBB6]|nr:MAG: hypothetical protein CFE46_09605 [Burkholderiales bacterium PBB6]